MKSLKIKLDEGLYDRARAAAEQAGYSSFDEFVAHALELCIGRGDAPLLSEEVAKQLRGLGYLE